MFSLHQDGLSFLYIYIEKNKLFLKQWLHLHPSMNYILCMSRVQNLVFYNADIDAGCMVIWYFIMLILMLDAW